MSEQQPAERSIEWLKGQERRAFWLNREKPSPAILEHLKRHINAGDVVCRCGSATP